MRHVRWPRWPSLLIHLIVVGTMACVGGVMPGLTSTARAAPLVSDPASVVDPFIGTTNGGHDFPGAATPFGMVQWSPDTTSRPDGGGYGYNDGSIIGFPLTHIAGPGCRAAGDVPVLPTLGAINATATDGFSHADESASAGYYSVLLGNGVRTELTATLRTGMARFTFPSSTQANLIFKLNDSQAGDTATTFAAVGNSEVTGSVTSGHFCGAGNTYTVYFDMAFDQPFTTTGTSAATVAGPTTPPPALASSSAPERSNHPVLHGTMPTSPEPSAAPGPSTAYVTFDTTSDQVVQAKVGVSYVSVGNARSNLAAENAGWSFSTTRQAAHDAWNDALHRIGIAGGTPQQRQVFYTALYHSLQYPSIFSDANGQYLGFNGRLQTVDPGHFAEYANYSGWDVYRSQAQLTALIEPAVASDIAQSMLDDYSQTGRLPKWNEYNGQTYVMVGDPADEMIADYYAFGARNFDTAQALSDMIAEASMPSTIRPGQSYRDSLGYLPSNGVYGCCNFYGPVSTQLEYDSADVAIGWLAGQLGDTSARTTFISRAQDWRSTFNVSSGFMQPRMANGAWTPGFTATGGTDFVEGNAWQYTGMVPFNIRGLVTADGGSANYNVNYLNKVLSGFHGSGGSQANLGNEPSLALPWEFDYTGEPYATQGVVRRIQDQIWNDEPSGLAGGDDLGEMSSWFVWSALGMYPETPGTADLALGSPMFTLAVVALPSGAKLTIAGAGAADDAPYVQSALWNGSPWNNAFAPRIMLGAGGTLTYRLGTEANRSWASAPSAAPPSYTGATVHNNVGVSVDANPTAADLDGGGHSYSATALSSAGVDPGSTITANGVSFMWPDAPAGSLDDYLANGQTVQVFGSGRVAFLGSATGGPSFGTATIHYSDGTTQPVRLTFSDWTLNGGSARASPGNATVVTSAYRNAAGGAAQPVRTYVFATPASTLVSGKKVVGVTLPATSSKGVLHVFAIGFTGPAGPIVSGVSSRLCVDDTRSGTVPGNPIQIWRCNGTGAQRWTVAPDGTLRVLGGCMDVAGTSSGTVVRWATCDGSAGEQWHRGANRSLVSPQSGLCLDDPRSSATPGARLRLWSCNATNAQRWSLP